MGDDSIAKKKKAAGQFTHWARPKWIRMYEYNYELGESYYRPQVKYISNSSSKVTSELYSSSSSTVTDSRRAYLARRAANPPPRAASFIERWSEEPFYGRGFTSRSRSEVRSAASYSAASNHQSEELSYASRVENRLRSSRARSVEAVRSSQEEYTSERSQRASSLSRQQQFQRESSYSSEMDLKSKTLYNREGRFDREGSLTRNTLHSDSDNMLKGRTLDESYNYEYPKQHLVCTERCPFFSDPVHHRRFVIGNRFLDAAALGGFDVLYDPTVFNNSRRIIKRVSEERDYDQVEVQRSSSQARATSASRYSYDTRY